MTRGGTAGGLCLAAALLAGNACARVDTSPWVTLHRTPETTVAVDTSRIEPAGDTARIWLRVARRGESGVETRVDQRVALRCSAGVARDLFIDFHMAGGSQVSLEHDSRWIPVADHLHGEALSAACRRFRR